MPQMPMLVNNMQEHVAQRYAVRSHHRTSVTRTRDRGADSGGTLVRLKPSLAAMSARRNHATSEASDRSSD